ncbi:UNVERIFIED_CONTAM: hypothetical protein PYX00_001361 [Menopon gallinae]|uniref:Biogenesis of lysosome-related organelles complex 1 subunit 4 n=1 Tax=Menopon gallinae TaxID=328185 RepID=A0AAW2IDJ7_9NEOP
MIEDLAKDYSNYIKVDFHPELQNVQDTIDDMLTRLDEFENLVNMVRTDGQLCVDLSIPQILKCKQTLDCLCGRIDNLEQFVNRVKSDMEIVESQVEEAEQDVGQNVRSFKNIFKPLFFQSAETPPRRSGRTPTYEPPTLFSTSSYFTPEEDGSSVDKT